MGDTNRHVNPGKRQKDSTVPLNCLSQFICNWPVTLPPQANKNKQHYVWHKQSKKSLFLKNIKQQHFLKFEKFLSIHAGALTIKSIWFPVLETCRGRWVERASEEARVSTVWMEDPLNICKTRKGTETS